MTLAETFFKAAMLPVRVTIECVLNTWALCTRDTARYHIVEHPDELGYYLEKVDEED